MFFLSGPSVDLAKVKQIKVGAHFVSNMRSEAGLHKASAQILGLN